MSLIPPSLRPGDAIGVVAPAGHLEDRERYYRGCSILSDLGFEIFEPDRTWPGFGYLADRDEARLEELHRLWAEPAVRAIFALRGGFGSLRLLEHLDLALIRRTPKLLCGFSDISVLLNHLAAAIGLVCLHGPSLATLPYCDRDSLARLHGCLRGEWHHELREDIEMVRSGSSATGPLLGGNLSSLVTLLGTPWSPDYAGSILFLEDVHEPPYRLDRLLTQFFYSGAMHGIRGLILGQFSDDDADGVERLRRDEFVWQRVTELIRDRDVPVWGNFPAGHRSRNLAIPIGVTCTMDCSSGTLRFAREQDRD